MGIKWLLAFLILIVFISGCLDDTDEIKPKYSDNALKTEIRIREEDERRRILPDQTIRMTVTLTNQVENQTDYVYLRITDPHGILISKVDCGYGYACDLDDWSSDTEFISYDEGRVRCYFNGCYYDSIQSLDQEEITFGLKIPSEEQISAGGRELNPEIMLKYNYSGVSVLYVPIYNYGEKPVEPKKEFTQTTGPIHVDIDSDNWVRTGDLFPIYVDVKDVAHSTEELVISNTSLEMWVNWADIKDNGEKIGRCDFERSGSGSYSPEESIILPQRIPLVCTLRAQDISAPMVKASIEIDYDYEYKVKKTKTIRVEKSLLGIF